MASKALFFFPHNPYPPRSGAHRRALTTVGHLNQLGYEVTLASSTLFSQTDWNEESILFLKSALACDIQVHVPDVIDRRISGVLRRYRQGFQLNWPLNKFEHAPPRMRHWFRQLIENLRPDVIFMNYAMWDGLVKHADYSSITRFIDAHDTISLNSSMQLKLARQFSRIQHSYDDIPDIILRENFFEGRDIDLNRREFEIYDKYDYTIAISESMAEMISLNTTKTSVLLAPMTEQPNYIDNSHSGPALFTMGPNWFNLQGYYYFTKRVLPDVLKRAPDFRLLVTTGMNIEMLVPPGDGIKVLGYVRDLTPVYASNAFFVCPVFGGTGQQVKIIDAMANGLAVVALKTAAEASPLQHGINGLVAESAAEFSEYTIQLWQDRRLCARLGNEARETIARDYFRSRGSEFISLLARESRGSYGGRGADVATFGGRV